MAEELLSLGNARTFAPGEVILLAGDIGRHAVVLLRGAVRVTGVNAGGSQTLLALRVGGDVIGELAALDGAPRSATVTSAAVTSARSIPGTDFLTFLRRRPDASLTLNRVISAKMRRAIHYRVDFTGTSVLTRLCQVLLELVETHGTSTPEGIRINAHLTQEDLAKLASTTRASVEREVRRLRKLDAVRTGRLRLVVTSPDTLRAIVSSASVASHEGRGGGGAQQ